MPSKPKPDQVLRRRAQQPVAITGLWTRTSGTGPSTCIEVLVEIDHEWRLVQTHGTGPLDMEISHITEPLGLTRAKLDPLGD